MKKSELQKILNQHALWLKNESGESGERAYLQGADLQGADLQGTSLQGADLRKADLQGADLQGTIFQGADLRKADLRGADLRGAHLQDADLQGAYLRRADLRGADLRGTNLQDADLRGTNFDFSSGIPFHCGSMYFKGDDRLFAQMIYHLMRGDWSQCSGGVQESVAHIRDMAISDYFCEFRDDIK